MPSLDEKMSAIAEQVLKRPLNDEEKLDIYKISDAMGMSNVQSFLHQLLVFKLHEDAMKNQFAQLPSLEARLNEKFDEMESLSAKIDETLKSSVGHILGEGARNIGRDMGRHIADSAKDVLGSTAEFHYLRGQVMTVCLISMMATLAYWLGTANVISVPGEMGPIDVLFMLPAGWVAFTCCFFCSLTWGSDHWEQVKRSNWYKAALAAQALMLFAFVIYLYTR
jgi:hypothetical protein